MEDRNSYREEEMNDQSLDVKYIESEERWRWMKGYFSAKYASYSTQDKQKISEGEWNATYF